ncbi:MAG: putative DNA binding domain-containing protein [Bacteriovoracaceae bacterium]|nr:putative DNA binding domain-containing protein [Bacteriovoracaceae bacterium]
MSKLIYPDRESKILEFKEDLPQKKQLIKTCVAFANDAGGEIIIGIADQTREIVGVSEKNRDKIFEETINSIYDSVSPILIPEIFEKNLNGKVVVVIKVYPGNKPPYFVKNEGSKKGVYLRAGASTRRATDEYIEELYRQQRKTSLDEELTNYKLEDLDPTLLQQIYGKQYSTNTLLADKVISRNPINSKELLATKGGALFFSDTPDELIPEAIIICSQFKGRSGRSIIRTTKLRGAIPTVASTSLELIKSWIEKDLSVKHSGRLEGEILIPEVALREGIINALVHRKYFIPGAIKIALYDDHLDVFSPGGFPGLVSLSNLGDGTTFLRNPIIAKLARRSKLIEKLGSGIRLIFDSCKNEKLKTPVFDESGDFVKLTFFFEKELDENLSEDEKIIQLAANYKELKIKDLVDTLGISRNTATRRLNGLIDQGIFKRIGKGPSTYFKLVR